MSRTIFIGDVHGCLAELKLLMDKINPRPEDFLVFVGDLVDKGPDSAGVVKYVRLLECNRAILEGNHEGKHRRFRRQINEGKVPKMKNAEEIAKITSKLSEEDIEFLDWATPSVRLGKFLAVHAGISPALKHIPSYEEFHSAKGKLRDLYCEMTMVRYVNKHGRMIMLGEETANDPFWTEVYDGRFGYIVYGHQPYHPSDKPIMTEHTAGIDLGCVFGGYLCAFESPEKYTVVRALDKYAKSFKDDDV